MWAVLSMAAGLLFVNSRVASAESPEPKSPSPVIATATPAKVPPIPVAGPLARPRSLNQVGLPIQQTLAEIPPDNPQTPEKIALGEKLFFEPRLSADGTVACASCHNPERAFTDGRPASVGVQGRVGQRNAPTVLNRGIQQEAVLGREIRGLPMPQRWEGVQPVLRPFFAEGKTLGPA